MDRLKLKLDASQIRSSSLQDSLLSSEVEMEELDLKISRLQEEKGRLSSRIDKLRDDLQGTDENIRKLSAEQENGKGKRPSAQLKLKRLIVRDKNLGVLSFKWQIWKTWWHL